jgi:Protein of unknown function (DUF1697)
VSRPRYVALLRAITNVPMKPFRRALEELGFTDVESYATSGNLLFNARASDPAALERRIAARVGTAASDADGSDPRPITGQKGLAAAPSSKVLGWTADGGALVVLGPGGPVRIGGRIGRGLPLRPTGGRGHNDSGPEAKRRSDVGDRVTRHARCFGRMRLASQTRSEQLRIGISFGS